MRRWWVVGLLGVLLLFAGRKKSPPRPSIPDYQEFVSAPAGKGEIDLALQSLAELGGGTLTLSEGVFMIDAPIRLISNMILQGQGENTVIKLADGVEETIEMIECDGVSNVTIRNLTLQGNAEWAYGVYIVDSTNINVENISINEAYNGMVLRNSLKSTVTGVTINNCGIGILLEEGSEDIKITEAHIESSSTDGIYFNNARNCFLTNSIIKNNIERGIRLRESGYINIIDCVIYSNGREGIYLNLNDGSKIQNNEIHSNSNSQNNGYSNVFVRDSGKNLIQGNRVSKGTSTNKADYGIRIDGEYSIGNIITGNACFGSGNLGAIYDNGDNTVFGSGNQVNDGTWIIGADVP